MTDQPVKATSDTTGTFRVVVPAVQKSTETGSEVSASGKPLPVSGQDSPDLKALAEKLNLTTTSIGRKLRFQVDLNSNHSVIQVLDRETGEVIREIPPEKARITAASNGELEIRLLDSRI